MEQLTTEQRFQLTHVIDEIDALSEDIFDITDFEAMLDGENT